MVSIGGHGQRVSRIPKAFIWAYKPLKGKEVAEPEAIVKAINSQAYATGG